MVEKGVARGKSSESSCRRQQGKALGRQQGKAAAEVREESVEAEEAG